MPASATASRNVVAVVVAVTSPCWLAFGGVLLGLVAALTLVSLMVDSLFLAPAVLAIHALLRHLGS